MPVRMGPGQAACLQSHWLIHGLGDYMSPKEPTCLAGKQSLGPADLAMARSQLRGWSEREGSWRGLFPSI